MVSRRRNFTPNPINNGTDMADPNPNARLDTHEAVCAIRYEGICARLKRLEGVGLTVAGAIIMMLLSIILKMN